MTTENDAALEQEINWALLRWQTARGPTAIRKAYNEFRKLVAQRSPAAVEALERERGIFTEGK